MPIETGNEINGLTTSLKWSFLVEEDGKLIEVPDTRKNDYILNEVIINTDYKSGEECFQVKFKEKIPIESLSQISKFTVERKSDKF